MVWWARVKSLSANQRLLMFVIGAGTFVAVGNIASGVVDDIDARAGRNKANTAYERSARIQAQANCRYLAGIDKAYCAERIFERARDKQRQENQLYADQKAAIWTAATGQAGAFGLLFSALTFAFIALTLFQQMHVSRRARLQFLISRRHDRASFAHTQWVSHQELRPYVFVDNVAAVASDDRLFEVTVFLKNFGKTPARNLETIVTAYVTYDLHKLRSHRPKADKIDLGTCAPNAIRRVYLPLEFTKKQWEAPPFDQAWAVLRIKYTFTDDSGLNSFEEMIDYHASRRSLDRETPLFYILTEADIKFSKRIAAKQGELVLPMRRSRLARREKPEGQANNDA